MENMRSSRVQVVENPPTIEGRVPPHDLEAEAAVLSAVMLDPGALDKVPELKPEHFYSEAHRRIFEASLELRRTGQPVDVVQIGSWLKDRQRLAQVGGAAYLQQILDSVPVVANVAAYGTTIYEKFRIRQLILACQKVTAQVSRDPTACDDEHFCPSGEHCQNGHCVAPPKGGVTRQRSRRR